MKKKSLALILLLVTITVCIVSASTSFFGSSNNVNAAENDNAEEELGDTVDEMLDKLDTSALEEFLNSLTDKQKKVFGANSVSEYINKIIAGNGSINFGNFMTYLLQMLGVSIVDLLPFMISILVICIAFNLINSIKGKFASDSVESIVHFTCLSLVVVTVLAHIIRLITSTLNVVSLLKTQMNIVFPIILTMMAATGATSSVAAYQPAVAILSGGIAELITALILPMFIFSIVFTIVGSISKGVKLQKMSNFFSSASKWLLGTVFFVFIAFLSIQGITASVFDGVSVRTAKFAISKYIPIIGGYLSEGLNLVMAGSVLIKNAVGMTAVVLLFISVAPLLLNLILFNLCLSLTGAIVEPLGNSKISEFLTSLGKNMNMLIAVVAGIFFLYFIFLILVVATGNIAI